MFGSILNNQDQPASLITADEICVCQFRSFGFSQICCLHLHERPYAKGLFQAIVVNMNKYISNLTCFEINILSY